MLSPLATITCDRCNGSGHHSLGICRGCTGSGTETYTAEYLKRREAARRGRETARKRRNQSAHDALDQWLLNATNDERTAWVSGAMQVAADGMVDVFDAAGDIRHLSVAEAAEFFGSPHT